ncbi:glycoside hydrolase family 127 protein [Paenibacillus puldeungensis]|uniref:Glycoside hydrolase family 127 protein n=1 Tax=Paenibacillus puldeungensis TaxID=696536 RepID=A0ABW3S3R8_9BACL
MEQMQFQKLTGGLGLDREQTRTLPLSQVKIEDSFWSEYVRLVREVVVPYQWEALNDRVPEAAPSYAIRNFRIATGQEQGEFGGMVFQDSDPAKWLEAVGYLLQSSPDPELEALADELVDLIAAAQHPDGYVNNYFTLKEPDGRWTNLAECHELYVAGHLIEGAVAYFRATGKRKILDVACRLADCIDTAFGEAEGKLEGFDGHEEIELALVKLYQVTGELKYLELSQFFLDQRGTNPNFYAEELEKRGGRVHFGHLDIAHDLAYSQAHLPIREQATAEGHAVRLVYLATGMADVAAETGDENLTEACRKLWSNIVTKRMYITGAIGSQEYGESFTFDYDLPNDTVYAETCASIGLVFFARRMLRLEPRGEYADVMERALYNTVVAGMSRDGKSFFYVNPLEVRPGACSKSRIHAHVKPVRQGWFGCACCPPNIARLLASLGEYMYTIGPETIYTHLYIGGTVDLDIAGAKVSVEQMSTYHTDGQVTLLLNTDLDVSFTLALRIPSWSGTVALTINGVALTIRPENIKDGYLHLKRVWQTGDTLDLRFDMPILKMRSHTAVPHTVGKVALQRGPFVYCLEEADNGPALHRFSLPKEGTLSIVEGLGDLPEGVCAIRAEAQIIQLESENEPLYQSEAAHLEEQSAEAIFIPYFFWANRGQGEMNVWVRETF